MTALSKADKRFIRTELSTFNRYHYIIISFIIQCENYSKLLPYFRMSSIYSAWLSTFVLKYFSYSAYWLCVFYIQKRSVFITYSWCIDENLSDSWNYHHSLGHVCEKLEQSTISKSDNKYNLNDKLFRAGCHKKYCSAWYSGAAEYTDGFIYFLIPTLSRWVLWITDGL